MSPDGYIEEHGADVLRCALLFSAPWERGGEFSDRAVAGVERFLARCWQAVEQSDAAGNSSTSDRVITAVTEAVERFAFNVAIARLMEFVGETHSADDKRVLIRLLAPFAPHLAEELWSRLGEPFSVHTQPWPQPRVANGGSDVEVAVQADGRLRGVITTDDGAPKNEVVALARKEIETVPGQAETVRVIYVPGKVVNFVTR